MKECPNCNLCFDDAEIYCPHDGKTLIITHDCKVILNDRYILEQRQGKGGMATVYRAKHRFLKSLHAIKIISPEVVKEDETLLIRFRQEAILAASIYHPNVVNVTDFGVENNDTPFLVMEFIEGICLDDYLRKEKQLSPTKAFEILKPIALGVGEAHKKGITHRDLKPLNVMLRKGYPLAQAIKVLDFGLAKIKTTEMFASLVQAKTMNLLGSPLYMSPEQWANEGIDSRSDIYSLGVILFQMLAGDVPFKGDSIPNIMYQHLQNPPPSFDSLNVSISPQIELIVKKALAKTQEQRYQTVEELLDDYENVLNSLDKKKVSRSNEKSTSHQKKSDVSETTDRSSMLEGKTFTDFALNEDLPYLSTIQSETLVTYFNQPDTLASVEGAKLAKEFIIAQTQVKEARSKISEADKLAQEFNEAQKAAEDARQKLLQAQQKVEEDIRREMQEKMEKKLTAEKKAREKAEAEAQSLIKEAEARRKAEERANELAKTALEAQRHAEEERQKAEEEVRQRQLEEGTRLRAEQAALRLADQAAEAKRRYEEAKKEAEREAYFRFEAEAKHKKVEEEIQKIGQREAEKRRLVEEEAEKKIKEQALQLEKQALDAKQKAEEASRLAESEAKKREQAELAKIKAEEEARRLAEEIIEAQKRLEEAEQRAKSEAEKRALEEEARRKAEEEAHSFSLENQKSIEDFKKILISQIEEAQLLAKSFAERQDRKENIEKSAEMVENIFQTNLFNDESIKKPVLSLGEKTSPALYKSSGKVLTDTSSADISKTNRIPKYKIFNPVILLTGFFAILLGGTMSLFLLYHLVIPGLIEETANKSNPKNVNSQPNTSDAPKMSERLSKKMVLIKGGNFQMGSDVDPGGEWGVQSPIHTEKVSDFYIDRTEVTNEEYAEFIKSAKRSEPGNWEGGKPPLGQQKFPVTYISYNEAEEFARWISEREEMSCRLPEEKEWEYAARGGKQQNIFPWGHNWIPDRANINYNSPKEVGTSADETSINGIMDMMGNVVEWTSTTFDYYPGFKGKPDKRLKNNFYKVVRGASFMADEGQRKNPHLLLTDRTGMPADSREPYLGFRLVCHPKM